MQIFPTYNCVQPEEC